MYLPQGLLAARGSFHEIRFWHISDYHNPDVRGYIVSSHDTSLYMLLYHAKIFLQTKHEPIPGFLPAVYNHEGFPCYLHP